MKRSELKEAIKAEITSVLSEQSNNPDFDKKVASFAKKINNEMDYPGGVLEAMKQIKSRLERIISKVEDAKRGGAEEEPLMKMIGLKEAIFNEEAVLEDVMIAIDFHLDGEIDYDEMSKRVEDLILGKIKPDFKVMNEGIWSTGTVFQIQNFLRDLEKIKTQYYDIVGSDDVFNGLDQAESAAKEMMMNAPENKSDIREDEDEDDKAASKSAKKEKIGRQASKLSQADEDRYERIKNGLEKLKKKGDEESIKKMKAILGKEDVQKLIKAKGRTKASFM